MRRVVVILGVLAAVGMVHAMFFAPQDVEQVNQKVNEKCFDQLSAGMTGSDVKAVLGPPHQVKGGKVFRLESAETGISKFSISETSSKQGADVAKLYRGPQDESICVLFSGETREILAAEYRIAEKPVLYRGPTSASSIRSSGMASVPRGTRAPDYADWSAAQLLRSQALLARRKPVAELSPPRFGARRTDAEPTSKLGTPDPQSTQASRPFQPSPTPRQPSPKPSLPSSQPPIRPSGPYVVPRIKLPSGAALSESLLKLPDGWQETLFPLYAPVVVAQYPNRTVHAIVSLKLGKMHGPTVTLHEDGHLASLANCAQGELHEDFWQWDENRQRTFFARFALDNREGLACLFRNGRPWLIQEWKRDEVQAQYLVVYEKDKPVLVPEADLTKEQYTQFGLAQLQQEEVWAGIRKTHKQLTAWLRKDLQQLKKNRVAVLLPEDAPLPVKPAARGSSVPGAFDLDGFEAYWRTALMNCGL